MWCGIVKNIPFWRFKVQTFCLFSSNYFNFRFILEYFLGLTFKNTLDYKRIQSALTKVYTVNYINNDKNTNYINYNELEEVKILGPIKIGTQEWVTRRSLNALMI